MATVWLGLSNHVHALPAFSFRFFAEWGSTKAKTVRAWFSLVSASSSYGKKGRVVRDRKNLSREIGRVGVSDLVKSLGFLRHEVRGDAWSIRRYPSCWGFFRAGCCRGVPEGPRLVGRFRQRSGGGSSVALSW
ncbi:hypothetical protein Tco_1126943 [Tanacetum coccineum]